MAHSTEGEVRDYKWSPGGGWLAFSMNNTANISVLYIWSLQDRKLHQVTNGTFDESSPEWDPKGDYLYYHRRARVSSAAFADRVQFRHEPFPRHLCAGVAQGRQEPVPDGERRSNDQEGRAAKSNASKDKDKDKEKLAAEAKGAEKDANKDKGIDFDGLAGRATRVPVEADNYFGLGVKADALIYATGPAPYYGREAPTKPALHIFAFKDRKDTKLVDDIGGFVLSRDGSKVLVRQGPAWNIYDATPTGASSKKTVLD